MREGKWYLEVKVEVGGGDRPGEATESHKGDGSHVRLGWGRREAPLNGPVGLDGYSYGFRDKTGDKVTLSRPRPYGKPFKSGDVIGMYISLPPLRQPNKKDPHDPAHIHRERIPIDFKGQEVFEILEYPVSKEMSALMESTTKPVNSASVPSSNTKKPAAGAKAPDRAAAPTKPAPKTPAAAPLRPLPILKGSRIAFFVNGECQGVAFEDLYDFLPLRQTENQRKSKGRRKDGVKEHRENPFDDGTLGYYPMISLFNDAIVRLNPGPDFAYPPPDDIDALLDGRAQPEPPNPQDPANIKTEGEDVIMDPGDRPTPPSNRTWRPAIERYPEFMKEQWELDALEEEEAKIEFEKQKARDEAGVSAKASRDRKTEVKRVPKASNSSSKRSSKKSTPAAHPPSEDTSKAGTPIPEDELIGPGVIPKSVVSGAARTKKSKGEAQAYLGFPQEFAVPQSVTETPNGTPPPSVSSNAVAAAAAHLHLNAPSHQEPSNRPSPSPLRQSTAYRDFEFEEELVSALQRDTGAPTVLIGPGMGVGPPPHAPRSRAPPGSKEGRQRAAAAAAAAHQVWSSLPPASASTSTPIVSPAPRMAVPETTEGPLGDLMSLAEVAESSTVLPVAKSFPSSTSRSWQTSDNISSISNSDPSGPQHTTRVTTSGNAYYDEDDVEADFFAAAERPLKRSRTPRSESYPGDEEQDDTASRDRLSKGPSVPDDDDMASARGDDDDAGTTDAESVYPTLGGMRDGDNEGTDDDMGRTRSQSPA